MDCSPMALDVLPQAVFLAGLDHVITYCNTRFYEVLGADRQPANVLGRTWHSLLQAGAIDEEGLHQLLQCVEQSQQTTRILDVTDAAGVRRLLRFTAVPMQGTTPAAFMGLVEDVTLSNSADELHGLLTSGIACMRLGVSIIEVQLPSLDAAAGTDSPGQAASCQLQREGSDYCLDRSVLLRKLGRLLYANPALEQMTGWSLPEMQAGGLGCLFGPSTNIADIYALVDSLHNRQASTVKVACHKPDGKGVIWSSISVTPINQLPFNSVAWVPPTYGGCLSPGQDGYSRSNSKEVGAVPSKDLQSTGQQVNAVAAAMARLASGGNQLHSSCSSLQALSQCAAPNTVHYLCIHDDISERVSVELSWQLRDHALCICSEGITIADPTQPDAPLMYVNDAFCQITGYSREDVLGKNCRFLQGKETSPEAVASLRAAVKAKRTATVELLNYRKNGEVFWNRLSITPMFNERGELVSYIGVQSDVTELIRRKEEERRLMEAKVAAETATEAKSMFLANMSHEIRTPLNGMMATAQLLLASVLTPEQRELAETILDSGNSLLGILGDILDFSKLDHGSITLTLEPTSLRRSIEACMEIVAPDAMKKGLALYYTCDDMGLSRLLMADNIRLRQVVTNLLSNAVKFTDKGEVHVDVRVEALPASYAGLKLPDSSAGQPNGQGAAPAHANGTTGAEAVEGTQSPTATTADGDVLIQTPASLKSHPINTRPSPNGSSANQLPTLPAPHAVARASAPSTPCLISSHEQEEQGWDDAVQHRRYSLEDRHVMPDQHAAAEDGFPLSHPLREEGNGQVAAEELQGAAQRAAVPDRATSRVRISVRDTGIGIPANLKDSLFQCFKQGSESMARRYGGTGLGLAICKRLSELMQGTVWVESEGRGKGCVFHFCVPADFPAMPSASSRDTLPGNGASDAAEVRTPSRTSGEGPGLANTLDEVPATGEEADAWSGIFRQPGLTCEAASYASSSTSSGGVGGAPSINVSQGQFQLLAPEDHVVLEGRKVLVDVCHPGVALQIAQSCRTLGMRPTLGCSCNQLPTPTGQDSHEVLVVSTERATAALKAGWKGRPVVAVGNRDLLSTNLHPLVVMLSLPVLHSRLANALVKSTVLLRWAPGSKAQGPKLTHQPISPAQIADFKSWRDRGHGASLSAALLGHHQPLPRGQYTAGQYVGGQLAIPGATAVPVDAASGFMGGFLRPYSYDASAMARRSSLDNSSLDRSLVQQALAATQARTAAISLSGTKDSPSSPSHTKQKPGATPGPPGVSSHHASVHHSRSPWQQAGPGMQLPQAIPENTVLQTRDSDKFKGTDEEMASRDIQISSTYRPKPAGSPFTNAAPDVPGLPLPSPQPTSNGAANGHARSTHQGTAASGVNGGSAVNGGAVGSGQQQQPLRILIAEDNKVNQKVVLKVLQQISGGAITEVVENGLQVLQALEKKSYDIILMDIHMPEMDGLEATRRIVATYPIERRPRIIALSADTLQALHDRCREAGIEEFIVKPFRIEDLRRVMRLSPRSPTPGALTSTPVPAPVVPSCGASATAAQPAGDGITVTPVQSKPSGTWHASC